MHHKHFWFYRCFEKKYKTKQFKGTEIMIIAVDFDGTIVEHRYPDIGTEKPFAIDTLKKLKEEQHRLILWTVREGKLLEEAVEFCKKRGLEFYAVNKNYPEESIDKSKGYKRKLIVDLWIDDRNLGGLPDWGTIYQMIDQHLTFNDLMNRYAQEYEPKSQIGFFGRLFK